MKGKLSLSRHSRRRTETRLCSETERQLYSFGRSGSLGSSGDGLNHSSGLQAVASQQKRHFSFTQHNSKFLKFLNEDRQRPSSFCDLNIVVSGKRYSVHKVVMAFGSRYFHGQLTADPETSHMTVDRVEDSTFQHLLRFLYTSEFIVSDGEIPSLVEAAKFLDMIDAVSLLTAGEISAVPVKAQESMAETCPSDALQSPVECSTRVPGGSQCGLCSRTFCYRKSLENHLARSHSREGLPDERRKDTNAAATSIPPAARRSARKRKCPAKFDRGDCENVTGAPNQSGPDKSITKETPVPTEEEEDENEEDGDEEIETQGQGVEADRKSVLDGEDRLSEGNSDEAEQQPDMDGDENIAGTEGPEQSYPEGLAPLIIQSSSKKTLKCPKCDKTFDRAGKYESHTRVHTGEKPFQCDICHQCYSTKSNLTVHRKKHNSEMPFQKKEHKCPFCNKLHASKKTLAKHVRR